MRLAIQAATAVSLLFACIVQSGDVLAAAAPPAGAVPMTPDQLLEMYSGKTQAWPDGAGGWFFAKDRRLSGYASKPPGSYAVGKWYITDSGKVCVRVKWVWAKGKNGHGPFETTCWAHQKVGSQIWKENPKKKNWYEWNASGGESSTFITGYKFFDQVAALHAKYGSKPHARR